MSRFRMRLPALPAPIGRFFAAHRSLGVVVAIAIVGVALPILSRIPPFGTLQSINAWTNAFTIAFVYAILAIGLNVEIGRAHV